MSILDNEKNALRVTAYRNRIKIALIKAFGEKCYICGKKFNYYMFDFHHIDPSTKEFGLSEFGYTRSKLRCEKEAQKCIMVCANCHREIEYSGKPYSLDSNFNSDIFNTTISELNRKSRHINEQNRDLVKKRITKNNSISAKPDRDTLKKLIRTTPFTRIASMFGVSDNAIRKWAIKYGLPSKVSEISKISDETWRDI